MTSHLRTRARAREASDIGEPSSSFRHLAVDAAYVIGSCDLAIGAVYVVGTWPSARHRFALGWRWEGGTGQCKLPSRAVQISYLGVSDLCTGEGADGKTIGNGGYCC